MFCQLPILPAVASSWPSFELKFWKVFIIRTRRSEACATIKTHTINSSAPKATQVQQGNLPNCPRALLYIIPNMWKVPRIRFNDSLGIPLGGLRRHHYLGELWWLNPRVGILQIEFDHLRSEHHLRGYCNK